MYKLIYRDDDIMLHTLISNDLNKLFKHIQEVSSSLKSFDFRIVKE